MTATLELIPTQASILAERPEAIWLALGTILMLLGTVYFIAKGWGVTDPKQQEYYIITIMIPGIATAAYLSMFFGYGLTQVPVNYGGSFVEDGTLAIYWARYADWLFTTPLLLLDLGLLANADRNEIGALIGLDAFMIVTGLVGALSKDLVARYTWWFISTVAMVLVLYFLYSVLTARVQMMDEDTRSTFKSLRNLVLVLWTVYPILWLVGTEGAQLVPLFAETLGFMILDVTAKVGFGIILLRSRAIIGEDRSAPEPSAAATAD
ncbi:rhodopsin [Halobacteriales archaeon QS_5_70_15]|nr:MAG: rhodopsin [Halobacteriales archaeon QS_5_70_15]